MELASITFFKLIEMLIILLAGVIAYKTNIVTKEGNKTLSNILLMIVNPVILFMSFQRDYTPELVKHFIVSVIFALIAHAIGIIISTLLIRKSIKDYDVERIATTYSNCGFIGIPIINALFGSQGVFYLAAYLGVFNILLWTHGLILTTGKTDKKTILSGILSPTVISIVVGIGCSWIKLPEIITSPLNTIGDLNTPMAMIVAGVTLAQSNIFLALKNSRVYLIMLLKLLVIPILTAFVLILFKYDNIVTMTAIIEMACPTGASGTMFALRYGKNALYASDLYIWSTILSIITMPIVIMSAELIKNLI